MEERFEFSPTSLKNKLKHSLLCGCFKHYPTHYDQLSNETYPTSHRHPNHRHHRLTRTSSTGGGSGSMESTMRTSKSEEFNLKDKCRSFISRMGTTTPRGGQHHHHHYNHRKSHSTDFRYDPLSYALNFQDDDPYVDDFPFPSFSSRLPHSPRSAPIRSVSDGAFDDALSTSSDQHGQATAASAPPPREITAYI